MQLLGKSLNILDTAAHPPVDDKLAEMLAVLRLLPGTRFGVPAMAAHA